MRPRVLVSRFRVRAGVRTDSEAARTEAGRERSFMKRVSTSPQARHAARAAADRAVLAEVHAASEERQAKSAALREARLAKEAKDAAAAAKTGS